VAGESLLSYGAARNARVCARLPAVRAATTTPLLTCFSDPLLPFLSLCRTGLKGAIVNFFKYRSIQKKKDISEDIIQLGFYVDCSANEEHSPYRWMRLAVSPYEGSWDDGIMRMLYIWQRKRFQPVLLPDTSKGEKGCPNACAMAAQGNKFVNTGEGGSKAIVKAVAGK
jgi:hypothetical protein